MRAKRKADQALTPSRTTSKLEIDSSSLKSSSTSSPNFKISTSLLIPTHDPVRVNLPSFHSLKILSDHADTQERAPMMELQALPDTAQSKSSYTHSKPNNNIDQRDQMTGLEDFRSVSDSASSSDDSQISTKKHHDLNEEYDNPWKALRPKWHTNDDVDELQSDKESGYWSNSNETTTSRRARSMSNPFHTSNLAQGSAAKDNSQFAKNYCHPRPKSNELCRKWLRGQCDRGYTCMHIHEDLEYDGDCVSFLSLFCVLFVQPCCRLPSKKIRLATRRLLWSSGVARKP
jgi:hypothetical protein